MEPGFSGHFVVSVVWLSSAQIVSAQYAHLYCPKRVYLIVSLIDSTSNASVADQQYLSSMRGNLKGLQWLIDSDKAWREQWSPWKHW